MQIASWHAALPSQCGAVHDMAAVAVQTYAVKRDVQRWCKDFVQFKRLFVGIIVALSPIVLLLSLRFLPTGIRSTQPSAQINIHQNKPVTMKTRHLRSSRVFFGAKFQHCMQQLA